MKFYTENLAANAALALAAKSRKELLAAMNAAGLSSAQIEGLVNNKLQTLDVTVAPSVRQVVSVPVLSKLTSVDVLVEVCSASQESVRNALGEAVLQQCLVTVEGEVNVSVKVPKA